MECAKLIPCCISDIVTCRLTVTLEVDGAATSAPTNCSSRADVLTGRDAMSRPPDFVDDATRSDEKGLAAAQSDRRARRQPGPLPPHAARHEPGEARREARPDLPADPEIREGHQPHRRQPAVRPGAGAGRAGAVLLRGGAGRRAAAARGRRACREAGRETRSSSSCAAATAWSSTRPSCASPTPRRGAPSSIWCAAWPTTTPTTTRRRAEERRRAACARAAPALTRQGHNACGPMADGAAVILTPGLNTATRPAIFRTLASDGEHRVAQVLPVHQRVRFGGASGQGLRPHFRRGRRSVLPRRPEGRHRSLAAARGLRDAWRPPTRS